MAEERHLSRQRIGAACAIAFWCALTACLFLRFGIEEFLFFVIPGGNGSFYFFLTYTTACVALWLCFGYFRTGGRVAWVTLILSSLLLADAVGAYFTNSTMTEPDERAGWVLALVLAVLVPGSGLALLLACLTPRDTAEPTQ